VIKKVIKSFIQPAPDVKQDLTGLNFSTKVTQLLLLWQQRRFKMADIWALK
jgi:hypothetical protein